MQTIFWISAGAILGANLRYFVGQYVSKLLSSTFPYGTLVINVTGSMLLGLFLVLTSERIIANPRWRLFIAIGFCGGYTTFSSFAYETFALFEQGRWAASAFNVILTNGLCLIGVVLGAALARAL